IEEWAMNSRRDFKGVRVGMSVWILIGLALAAPLRAAGATLFVDSLADPGAPGDGQTTLREAIAAANADSATDSGGTGAGHDVIDLTGLSGVVALSAPLPDVSTLLDIVGPANQSLIISGGGAHAFIGNSGPGLLLSSLVF